MLSFIMEMKKGWLCILFLTFLSFVSIINNHNTLVQDTSCITTTTTTTTTKIYDDGIYNNNNNATSTTAYYNNSNRNNNNKTNYNNNTPNNYVVSVTKDDSIYKMRYEWDKSPIVIERYKLVFFTIPKVGCTVWKTLFRRMLGYKDFTYDKALRLHDPELNKIKYLYHYNVSQATYFMNSPDYTRAIFLRDPKERLLSAYTDKVLRGQSNKFIIDKCCNAYKDTSKTTNNNNTTLLSSFCNSMLFPSNENDSPSSSSTYLSFQDFFQIAKVCDNAHWRSQSKRMEPKFFSKLNYIGHLKTVEKDAKILLQLIGAWDEYGTTGWGRYKNESIFHSTSAVIHNTNANKQMKTYYTTMELQQQVEEYFTEDYEQPLFQF